MIVHVYKDPNGGKLTFLAEPLPEGETLGSAAPPEYLGVADLTLYDPDTGMEKRAS